MPVSAMPTPPSRSDTLNFPARADAWITQFTGVTVAEISALEANVNAKEASATAAATNALSSAATAQAAAAYKGEWSALTGALNMPASVSYGGFFYALNANLANVTTAVPGVASQWTQIVTQDSALVVVSTTTVTAATGQTLALANGAATAVTAPASPVPGNAFWVAPCNNLPTNTVLRNGSLIDGLADDIMLTDPMRTVCFLYINSLIGWRPL